MRLISARTLIASYTRLGLVCSRSLICLALRKPPSDSRMALRLSREERTTSASKQQVNQSAIPKPKHTYTHTHTRTHTFANGLRSYRVQMSSIGRCGMLLQSDPALLCSITRENTHARTLNLTWPDSDPRQARNQGRDTHSLASNSLPLSVSPLEMTTPAPAASLFALSTLLPLLSNQPHMNRRTRMPPQLLQLLGLDLDSALMMMWWSWSLWSSSWSSPSLDFLGYCSVNAVETWTLAHGSYPTRSTETLHESENCAHAFQQRHDENWDGRNQHHHSAVVEKGC